LATPKATRAVLAAHGLWTKKRLGQHFLVDDNVVARILALAALNGSETVLEVGPGIGTLTVALCNSARAVVAVERDRDLLAVLADTTKECAAIEILHGDAANIDPDLLADALGPPDAMVANLPYSVAATVVLRFFELLPSLRFSVVMVQAEVADRMGALPRTKDYGSYSVKLQLLTEPTGRFAVARSCFLPPPRVDSAVIRLDRRQSSLEPQTISDAFRAADAAFAQRRKTLRNSLKVMPGATAPEIDGALSAAGIDGSLRAEAVEPDGYVHLGRALRAAGVLD
jgi:16S rRNA (adenine1518-N6/adenine1519-N6)-dimethyltransferase